MADLPGVEKYLNLFVYVEVFPDKLLSIGRVLFWENSPWIHYMAVNNARMNLDQYDTCTYIERLGIPTEMKSECMKNKFHVCQRNLEVSSTYKYQIQFSSRGGGTLYSVGG